MKWLRFLFTARMSFVRLVFLTFAFTLLYLGASGGHEVPVTRSESPALAPLAHQITIFTGRMP